MAEEIAQILAPVAVPLVLDRSRRPHVILVVGVNGNGKTTTIGKLALQFLEEGLRPMLVAGDTFRAAAVEQLQIWGDRTGAPVISGPPNSDAAGLAFDAIKRAQTDGADVLLIDTAGRLHNKTALMDELAKIIRVMRKQDPTAPHSTLLVLDATTGHNALEQVRVFKELVSITGLIVTKLDGSARGGIVVALAEDFGLPVHAVGVGEQAGDLRPILGDRLCPRSGGSHMMRWLATLLILAGVPAAHAADPDALSKIVIGRCVPDQQAHGDPKPCLSVDLAGGSAVLKDIEGVAQLLLIPTIPRGGIEDPALLSPETPNYFAAAWASRSDMDTILGHKLPPQDISLAINSKYARSQNQFHIHVDCLSPEVIGALHDHASAVGDTWAPFPVKLAGHTYLARRLDEATLSNTSPFRLLADGVPGAAAEMAKQTLVLVGLDAGQGLILLTDHLTLLSADLAHGEELQDHSCAVASRPD